MRYTHIVSPDRDVQLQDYDFGIKDHKGRAVGANIKTSTCEFVWAPEDASWGHSGIEPGVYYHFVPHATRNGIRYGASQNDQWFKTPEERSKAIEKYLQSAKKRMAKQFGAK
jgi:hypothetical protein